MRRFLTTGLPAPTRAHLTGSGLNLGTCRNFIRADHESIGACRESIDNAKPRFVAQSITYV
jgi:hypothetical protein